MIIALSTTLGACERAATPNPVASTTSQSTATPTITPAPPAATHPAVDTVPRDGVHVPTLADTVDPGATVRAYLGRARAHLGARDSLVWEPAADGTGGFRAFADTTITSFTVGVPGDVEGAAGSRYVTVPLTVTVASGAATSVLHGTATLRRAVVDGATDLQRRWRIMRIDWSAPR